MPLGPADSLRPLACRLLRAASPRSAGRGPPATPWRQARRSSAKRVTLSVSPPSPPLSRPTSLLTHLSLYFPHSQVLCRGPRRVLGSWMTCLPPLWALRGARPKFVCKGHGEAFLRKVQSDDFVYKGHCYDLFREGLIEDVFAKAIVVNITLRRPL